MIPALIFLLLLFSFVLIKSADMVIVSLRRISRQTKTGLFALSAVILAVSTSFPELFVGITSALEGSPSVSLGDVIGSNIANITLVAGVAAFIVGRVRVSDDYLKREVVTALAAGILPSVLLLDGNLNRVDGLILLAVYAAYARSFFKKRFEEIAAEHQQESVFHKFLRRINHVDSKKTKEYGRLFIGIALLLFSADMIVKLALFVGTLANISGFVVGVVLVAVGTSLPELAFSLRSLEKHQPSIFFGNLLGSTIANSTLVLGVTSLIHPIELVVINKYWIAAIGFVVVFLTFWAFIKSKHRIDRWEAAILFLLYIAFVVVEFL